MTTALAVEGAQRVIGDRTIVDDVALAIADGELVALIGPSGCGKSTLLRLIAGLEPAGTAAVSVHDRAVGTLPPEKRGIGLVFQDHALFPHLSVDRNIAFGLRHLDRAARAQRVEELLDMVRLPGVGAKYPHQLSGGEQQRIALARALAPDPGIVLLDEPFANLDELLRDELRTDVIAALRANETAALLVTHDRDEALALGDRVAVMRDGRIIQIDRPDIVYEQPADRFVATFVGEAALFACDDGCALVARPHQLTLTAGGDAEVVERRYLGAVWRHRVRQPDGSTVQVDTTPAATLPEGAACTVTVDGALHRVR